MFSRSTSRRASEIRVSEFVCKKCPTINFSQFELARLNSLKIEKKLKLDKILTNK